MGRQGRAVAEYAAKMKAMGIDERSLAGHNNPIADHVEAMGRDKMRLLPGASIAPTGAAAGGKGKCSEFQSWGLLVTGWYVQPTTVDGKE